MPSSVIRQMIGDKLIRGTESRGKAFVKELGRVFSPEAIVKELPRTQTLKKKGY